MMIRLVLLATLVPGCFYIEGDLLGQPGVTYECEVTCQKDTSHPKKVWIETVCDVPGQAETIANAIDRRIEPSCSGRFVHCEPAFDFCIVDDLWAEEHVPPLHLLEG